MNSSTIYITNYILLLKKKKRKGKKQKKKYIINYNTHYVLRNTLLKEQKS